MKRLVAGIVVAGICTVASPLPASLTHAADAASRQAAGAPTPADIVATARAHLGDRYATIGNSPATGFSCIGFVNYVFGQNGVNVPFDIPAAWNSAPHVAINQLMPGDVLFFSNTVFAGLSHAAIYIGNGLMIGADSFAVGVTTDRLGDSYWTQHYTGATRPLALVGTAPMPGSGTTQAATATQVPERGTSGQGATATATPSAESGNTGQVAVATTTSTPVQQMARAPAGALLQPLANTVGIYSGPGYGYTSMGTLGPSSVLVVVQGQGDWYNVRFGDTYCWVDASDVGPVGGSQVQARTTPAVARATPEATPTQGFSRAAAISSAAGDAVLYVSDGPLKVRSGPGKSFPEIGYLQLGTRLLVLDMRPGWAHVTTPTGVMGWVAIQYLSRTAPTRSAGAAGAHGDATQVPGTARVTAAVLNVRAQPNGRARVLTVLFAGETVQVLARRTGWDQVKLRNGTVGWASAAWLADRARCGDLPGACPQRDR